MKLIQIPANEELLYFCIRNIPFVLITLLVVNIGVGVYIDSTYIVVNLTLLTFFFSIYLLLSYFIVIIGEGGKTESLIEVDPQKFSIHQKVLNTKGREENKGFLKNEWYLLRNTNWSSLKDAVFNEDYTALKLQIKLGASIVVDKNGYNWIVFLYNLSLLDLPSFDYDYTNKLFARLEPCDICGTVAVFKPNNCCLACLA